MDKLSYTDIIFIKTYSSVTKNKHENCWLRRLSYDVECSLNLLDEPCMPSLIDKNIKCNELNKLKILYAKCFNNSLEDLTESQHKYIKKQAKTTLIGNIYTDQEYRFIFAPLYANDVEFSKQKAITYVNKKINEKKYHGHNIQKIRIQFDEDFCYKWEEILLIDDNWKREKEKRKEKEMLIKAESKLESLIYSKYLSSAEIYDIRQQFESEKRTARLNNRTYDFWFFNELTAKINERKTETPKRLIEWILDGNKWLVIRNGFKYPVKWIRRGKKYLITQGGLIY